MRKVGKSELKNNLLEPFVGGFFIQKAEESYESHEGEILAAVVRGIPIFGPRIELALATREHINSRGMRLPFANYVRPITVRPSLCSIRETIDKCLVIRSNSMRLMLFPTPLANDELEEWFKMVAPRETLNY